MIKHTQLLLKFSRSIMRSLSLVPDLAVVAEKKSPPPHKAKPATRRELLLEALAAELLRAAGCNDLKVEVYWNSRLRTTAGLASWRDHAIYLNPRLMDVSQDEVQRTLRHELAHFLAQHRAGRRRIAAHGAEWKRACADLGIPRESRCHDLPFKRAKVARRYFYACPECGTQLARVRPLKRRVACLRCCRAHNHGQYHDRFRFVPIEPPKSIAA